MADAWRERVGEYVMRVDEWDMETWKCARMPEVNDGKKLGKAPCSLQKCSSYREIGLRCWYEKRKTTRMHETSFVDDWDRWLVEYMRIKSPRFNRKKKQWLTVKKKGIQTKKRRKKKRKKRGDRTEQCQRVHNLLSFRSFVRYIRLSLDNLPQRVRIPPGPSSASAICSWTTTTMSSVWWNQQQWRLPARNPCGRAYAGQGYRADWNPCRSRDKGIYEL